MAQAVERTRPQPGAKKRSAHQRIQDLKAAAQPAPKPEASNGHHLTTHEKEARKEGVRIRLWKKGSQTDPDKFTETFLVILPGRPGAVRVIRPDFPSAVAAKKSAVGFGLKVIE